MNEVVFVVIDKGAGAYEAFPDEEAAHKSIEGDESDFDVFRVPLRKEPFDSENPGGGGVQQP